MKNLFTILVLVFAAFSTNAQITNGGFEAWSGTNPDGWFGSKTHTTGLTVTKVTTDAHGGTNACGLKNTTTSHKRFTSVATSVTNGTVYAISFWIKGATGQVRTGMHTGNPATMSTTSGYIAYNTYVSATATWSKITQTLVADYTTTSAEFIISVGPSGDVVIDDVEVHKLLLCAGPDFYIICGGSDTIKSDISTDSGTITYQWAPSIGLNNTQIANPIVNTTTTNTYYVTATNGTETTVDSVTVYVNPLTANAGNDKIIICGGTAQLDNVTTNYTGTGNLLYEWSPSTGLDYNNVINPTASVITNQTYVVTVSTNGCIAIDSVNVIVNPLTANAGSDKTIICGGTAQLDNVTTNYTGTGNLLYEWSPSTGLDYNNVINPTATVISDMLFYVTVTTPNGCIAIDSASVFVEPLTINAYNTSTICGNPVILNTTNNYTGTGTPIYSWQPITGLNSSIVSNPSAMPSVSTTYTVILTSPNGCVADNQASVTLNPLPIEEICYVEFDITTTKNNINWSPNLSANIDTVHIYNEVSTDVWNLIGSVSSNQSNFIDINSNPFNQSYSYKISVKDTCGIETNLSAYHTTITLLATYDQGTNTYGFTWSAYQGLTIGNYYLYGVKSGGIETLIGTVPGNQFFYNYTNPDSIFVKYFVGFNTTICSNKSNYRVKSNYVQSTINGIIETTDIKNLIFVYPNPVKNELHIKTNNSISTQKFEIINNLGQVVYNSTVNQSTVVDMSALPSGVYSVKMNINNEAVYKRFVKE